MNMALLAFLYPSKVAGLVLVDVYYADLYARIQELFPRYCRACAATGVVEQSLPQSAMHLRYFATFLASVSA